MLPGNFCWHVFGPLEYRCVPVETSQIHSGLLPMYWEKTTDTFPSCLEWLLFARNTRETQGVSVKGWQVGSRSSYVGTIATGPKGLPLAKPRC